MLGGELFVLVLGRRRLETVSEDTVCCLFVPTVCLEVTGWVYMLCGKREKHKPIFPHNRKKKKHNIQLTVQARKGDGSRGGISLLAQVCDGNTIPMLLSVLSLSSLSDWAKEMDGKWHHHHLVKRWWVVVGNKGRLDLACYHFKHIMAEAKGGVFHMAHRE